mmetsp:Transcript_27272/g.30172  ORF Transcript_27272/g.30172 Transcript_27272/m.30172 type:complete len:170 (+) Transcript_27272:101-610(+)|eukprot:CAMPEP_0194135260 /NCGR_PEP_ID=MMETSP0152-20130528/5369_1 /TAXON_ID=1049557 /ORGANISM="Thalassiothrix antarctica, Strain L6-D1" /LENGTH=169 /DNA_ID=CAMNT_0038831427 /DNA_START=102 /DNA_END=611 /DNA_ORIENTATION=-
MTNSTTADPLNDVINIVKDAKKSIMPGDVVKLVVATSTKGRNVSGRSWKVRPQKRATFLSKAKHNNLSIDSWEVRQQRKLDKVEATKLQAELREERRQEKVLKRERRAENEKRRAENEFKQASAAAQNLNSKKIGSTLKAMSKKQLRQIKKSRMNTKTGVVEYVSAYSK